MHYPICLEEIEGRWIAHVPALPGCFASAGDRDTAQALAPSAIGDYLNWRRAHGDESIPPDSSIEINAEEIIREWPHPADPDYVVNAFFAADALTLTSQDIDQAQRLLEWSRADLLAAIDDLSHDECVRPVEGEWSIARILTHVGGAEWWYLDRLELAFPRDEVPDEWRARLDRVRARLLEVLPGLEGVARFEMKRGEGWSPRKIVRRALWHERDHTQHILQFRARLGA